MEQEKKKALLIKIIAFSAIGLVLLFYMVNFSAVSEFFSYINGILMPLFLGVVIAYLLTPIVTFYETRVLVWKKDTRAKVTICRTVAIILTFLTTLLILTIIMLMIVPQLISSIKHFISNFNSYIESAVNTANNALSRILNSGVYEEYVSIRDIRRYLDGLISFDGDLIQQIVSTVSNSWAEISTVGVNVFQFFKNGIIGIFIAIYIIASKELRLAQIRKFREAYFSDKVNSFITEVVATADKNFGGYIKGMIIDSFMIGVISFILFTVFNISEYNILISVFLGITNIIPVFGPFIGAVPAGFIVLVTNPSKLILFIILVILMQQIDGNIIVPKVLGNSTQVSSFAVLVAITIMGELLGVVGMIIGVPLFATIITIGKKRIEKKLEEKGKPTGVENYFGARLAVEAESIERREGGRWANNSKLKKKLESIMARLFKRKKKNSEADASDTDDMVLDERELENNTTNTDTNDSSYSTQTEHSECAEMEPDAEGDEENN